MKQNRERKVFVVMMITKYPSQWITFYSKWNKNARQGPKHFSSVAFVRYDLCAQHRCPLSTLDKPSNESFLGGEKSPLCGCLPKISSRPSFFGASCIVFRSIYHAETKDLGWNLRKTRVISQGFVTLGANSQNTITCNHIQVFQHHYFDTANTRSS